MARNPARPRSRTGGAAALALTVLLAGCGSVQELDPQEAESHYDAVIADVQAALGHELVHAPATRSFESEGGECLLTPGGYEADGLGAELGVEENWDPVLESLDPVLEEHGFETVDAPRREGAILMIAVEDTYGAELSLGENGMVRIHGARVSAEACEGQ